MFIGNTPADLILFFMLYGGVTMAALIACIYLCLRRGNALAPDITPPVPLRRWAAALFAVASIGHIWWYFFYVYAFDIHSVGFLVVSMLDCVGLLTTVAGTLFAMLQDRKRPVWPIVTATIPYAVLQVLNIVYPDGQFLYIAIAYILLVYLSFTVYMVFAVRRYGRWLRDNYADLEHKEVLVSHVLVSVFLLLIITYGFDGGEMAISYIVQFFALGLVGLLLWRVETLPDLTPSDLTPEPSPKEKGVATVDLEQIEQLLKEHCVDNRLYLKHGLSRPDLAQAIGTNRSYLSHYFTRQGFTFNTYINNLRINHFVKRYEEGVAAGQPVSAQQLAYESGFSSYRTFSRAFTERMGQSVADWMRDTAV